MHITETKERKEEIDIGVYRENGEFYHSPEITIPEGTKRGIKFICEAARHRNRRISEDFLKELHREVLYYFPGVNGQYRQSEGAYMKGTEKIDGIVKDCIFPLKSGKELEWGMYLYGQWLEESTEKIKDNPNNIRLALETACEASYGLISPDLHPFYDGNGRVSRLLNNLMIMINTHELMYYGLNILPVPELRHKNQPDPYILVLNQVHRTRDLNPYIYYVALHWMEHSNSMINNFDLFLTNKNSQKLFAGDSGLIAKYHERAKVLKQRTEELNPNKQPKPHPVPNFFKHR